MFETAGLCNIGAKVSLALLPEFTSGRPSRLYQARILFILTYTSNLPLSITYDLLRIISRVQIIKEQFPYRSLSCISTD